MKMKRTLCAILCMLFILMPILSMTNVFATTEPVKNRTLIINAEIDPRVAAEQLSITMFFVDNISGYQEVVTLTKGNKYTANIKTINGEFTLFSGMVSNDLMRNYPVVCEDFSTSKATTTITVIVGDPNYGGKVEETPFLPGDIDREATDKLREQHHLPPIDWEEIDELYEKGEYDFQKWMEDDLIQYKEDLIEQGVIGEGDDVTKLDTDKDGIPNIQDDDDDNDGIPDPYDKEPLVYNEREDEETEEEIKPTEDKDGDGDIDEDDANIEKEEKEQEEEKKEKQTRWYAIAFVAGVIIVFGVSIYFRNKYADLDE